MIDVEGLRTAIANPIEPMQQLFRDNLGKRFHLREIVELVGCSLTHTLRNSVGITQPIRERQDGCSTMSRKGPTGCREGRKAEPHKRCDD